MLQYTSESGELVCDTLEEMMSFLNVVGDRLTAPRSITVTGRRIKATRGRPSLKANRQKETRTAKVRKTRKAKRPKRAGKKNPEMARRWAEVHKYADEHKLPIAKARATLAKERAKAAGTKRGKRAA